MKIKLKKVKNTEAVKWITDDCDKLLLSVFLQACIDLYDKDEVVVRDAVAYLEDGDMWCKVHNTNYDERALEQYINNNEVFKKQISVLKKCLVDGGLKIS